MNKLFIDDLVERLETVVDVVKVCEQHDILDYIDDYDYKEGCNHFPMICFETSNDNCFNVQTSESKFLYDPMYKGTWIIGIENDTIAFIMCLRNINSLLHIDAFEVNTDMRGQGVGGNVVSVIESISENYFENIAVSPFDTDAMSFWEHMEYEEGNNGYWLKDMKRER